MSHPERMSAIRRLFLAKLAKMPSDMEHEERVESARSELDKVLGDSWRKEVEDAGMELDPTGDMQEKLDKLPMATRDAGYHGDDVPPPEKKKKKPVEKDSIIMRIIKIVGE